MNLKLSFTSTLPSNPAINYLEHSSNGIYYKQMKHVQKYDDVRC